MRIGNIELPLSQEHITQPTKAQGPQINFGEVLDQALSMMQKMGGGSVKDALARPGGLLPAELIGLQLKVHEMQLSMECLSKAADSLSGTLRKLQGNGG